MPPKKEQFEEEVQAPKKKKTSRAKKKTTKKITAASKKLTSTTKKSASSNRENNLVNLLVSIIVTAVIVGGGISIVQHLISKKNINQVKYEKETVKSEFENKLSELKNELQGTEEELKKTKENKDKLENIISKSRVEFKNEELGLRFLYPASFGEVNLSFEEGSDGRMFRGTFSEFNDLTFGGISTNYDTSRELTILDTQGFRLRGGNYFFKSVGEDPGLYPIEIFTSIELDEREIPIIDSENFLVNNEPELENNRLLALVNMPGEEFTGVAFLNYNTNALPLEEFERILKSIEIVE